MRIRIFILLCFTLPSTFLNAQNAEFSGRVILQGAYDPTTSLMRTSLMQHTTFPLQQPFAIAPWNYDGTESITTVGGEMVDWILLELRSSPDTAIARLAAIVFADGTIRDINGDSVLQFNVPVGQYFLAIIHRNHLPAMTAAKHTIQSGAMLDFADTTLPMYGDCTIGLGAGKRGMIGGDLSQDGILKYSGSGNDRGLILQRILAETGGTAINATAAGYFPEDLRMDSIVKYSGNGNDPSLIIQNLITLTQTTAINSTFSGSVPNAIFMPPLCTPQPDQALAGADNLHITDTIVLLQANQPVNGQGLWTIISGQGGSIDNDTLATTAFTGQAGSQYTLVWTISNHCGHSADTVLIGFDIPVNFSCGDTFIDLRDNQLYPTIQIGTQCWMSRNLNIGVMATSVNVGGLHSDVSDNGIIEKYCWNNNPSECDVYGGLYDWNEMMNYLTTATPQGICPTGWRIPTDADWDTLTTSLGGTTVAGGKMKEAGFNHWVSPNVGATNSSGFTALGAGMRNQNGTFFYLNYYTYFWSSSEYSSTTVPYRRLGTTYADITRTGLNKAYGLSVRCLKD